jgi:lysophospholipase L1-like esterase
MRFRLCVLTLLAGVAAVPAAAQPARLFVLGSSTAFGTGASSRLDSAWVFRYARHAVARNPNYEVYDFGVGGTTTYHIVPDGTPVPAGRPAPNPERNVSQALRFGARAVIVNMPSNDAVNGYTVEEQLRNFDRIVQAAAAQRVPVWVATTQPRTGGLNDAGRANLMAVRDSIRARYGSKALDFWTGLALPDGRLDPRYDSGDGIHLNDTGHRLLYERVVAARIFDTLVAAETRAGTAPVAVQVAPQPFAARTTLTFFLPSAGPVRLTVLDALGREVARLADGPHAAGTHRAGFEAAPLPAGLYVYRLTGPGGTATGVLVHTL